MTLETEIYQILRKHRLSLKKREEVIVDLLDFINKREEAITVTHCCKPKGTVKIDEDDKPFIEIGLIKKGSDPEQETWIEMTSVNDIFQQALLLNKKERKKLFKEFRLMTEQSILYKKACDELIKKDSKLKMPSFMWCND